jgi:hypothetical protein
MYLVAIKSFLHHLGYGNVEVVSDGTLTTDDIALIQRHVPGAQVTQMADVDVGTCPSGNCWERLVRILELIEDRYVIQLDSDTLTTAAIPEIHQAIQSQSAFLVGNPIWPEPTDVRYVSLMTRRWQDGHIQIAAEQVFADLHCMIGVEYCRGSAGFSGFPVQKDAFQRLQVFSAEIEAKLGRKRWEEWGSEQVASNVIVSMSQGAHVLPWPKYQNFGLPKAAEHGACAFYHFLGTHRFDGRLYARLTREAIRKLGA